MKMKLTSGKRFLALLLAFTTFLGAMLIFPQSVSAAEETYPVTVNVKGSNGSALRNVTVMIGDTYETTNRSGVATFNLANGTYTAIVGYTSGNYSYYGEKEFTVDGTGTSVTINVESAYSQDAAKRTYDNTTYFDHVDIRVKGNLTLTDSTTHVITIRNAELKVVDPAQNNKVLVDTSFTNNNETYEWRVTGKRIPKTAVVSLICDLYLDGELITEDAEFRFSGEQDFIQAIANCDIKQGLDFVVSAEEVKEIVYHDVSYVWDVVDGDESLADALEAKLDSVAVPPATSEGNAPDSTHKIDTEWGVGTHFIIGNNGVYYRLHFNGWLAWSDVNTAKTGLNGAKEIVTSEDTIIYGEWLVEALPTAAAYITLTKTITGVENVGELDLMNRWFEVTTPELAPDGVSFISEDVEFSMMNAALENNTLFLTYDLPVSAAGEYSIVEYGADINGYERTTEVNAIANSNDTSAISSTLYGGSFTKGEEIIDGSNKGIKVVLTMPQTTAEDHVVLGHVDFTNSYQKKVGNAVHNYPILLINKLGAEDRSVLSGAEFLLTPVVPAGQGVMSAPTDESGYTVFNFNHLGFGEGEYTLVETVAPQGYELDDTVYKITVSVKDGYPVERYSAEHGSFMDFYEYDVSVDPSEHFNATRIRLAVYNSLKYYEVDYVWEGIPDGLATPPETTDGYVIGETHTIDTDWEAGEWIVDEDAGKVYVFEGWQAYSIEADGGGVKSDIAADVTALEIRDNTTIHGVWSVQDIQYNPGRLLIEKSFSGNDGKVPGDLYFTVTDPEGEATSIPYSEFIDGKYYFTVRSNGEYTITEHKAEIPGYVLKTPETDLTKKVTVELNVLVPGSGFGSASGSGIMTYYGHRGTASFVNVYEAVPTPPTEETTAPSVNPTEPEIEETVPPTEKPTEPEIEETVPPTEKPTEITTESTTKPETTQETEPAIPSDQPNTGDSAGLGFWLFMFVAAFGGLGLMFLYQKRRVA